jgi:hypothetical protein
MWCTALCPPSVLARVRALSSYLRKLSLYSFPKKNSFSNHGENGSGGIRTRICDLDRVLCSHYTTDPSAVSAKRTVNSKVIDHIFNLLIPKRDETGD